MCHSQFYGTDTVSSFSQRARQPIIHMDKTACVFGRCSFSESTSVTPTEISNQPRRLRSRMSARFNVTRSSSDSQTYPPFAVQVASETKKDRDQFHWPRSFAFATVLGRGAINIRNSFRCSDRVNFSTAEADTDLECRESEIYCLRLERFVGRRCLH